MVPLVPSPALFPACLAVLARLQVLLHPGPRKAIRGQGFEQNSEGKWN